MNAWVFPPPQCAPCYRETVRCRAPWYFRSPRPTTSSHTRRSSIPKKTADCYYPRNLHRPKLMNAPRICQNNGYKETSRPRDPAKRCRGSASSPSGSTSSPSPDPRARLPPAIAQHALTVLHTLCGKHRQRSLNDGFRLESRAHSDLHFTPDRAHLNKRNLICMSADFW